MNQNLKNFWIFFTATVFSIMGLNLYIFTNGWYLLELGAERTSVATSWAIFFLPGLFLIFFSKNLMVLGRLKKSILVLEFLKALTLCLAVILFKFKASVFSVYLVSGVLGAFFVPFYPLTYAFLKELFKSSRIVKYSNISEVSFQLSGVIAMLSSGFIYKHLSFIHLTGVSAILLFVSALLISFIREDLEVTSESSTTKTDLSIKSSKLTLAFGFIHLMPQTIILLMNIPMLIYVEQVMKKGPIEYGILDACCAFSAMFVGFFWAYFSKASSRLSTLVVVGALTGVGLIIVGNFYFDFLIYPYLIFAVLSLFTVSFKMMSRGQLMLTHTAAEVAKYSLFYQLFSNICLVAGAFLMSIYLKSDNGQGSLAYLSLIAFIYLIIAIPVLKRINKLKATQVI